MNTIKKSTTKQYEFKGWHLNDEQENKPNRKPTTMEIMKLQELLMKYGKSERYHDVVEKEQEIVGLLQFYKRFWLDDELRKEALQIKDVSVENPYVGDLLVVLGHLKSQIINHSIE